MNYVIGTISGFTENPHKAGVARAARYCSEHLDGDVHIAHFSWNHDPGFIADCLISMCRVAGAPSPHLVTHSYGSYTGCRVTEELDQADTRVGLHAMADGVWRLEDDKPSLKSTRGRGVLVVPTNTDVLATLRQNKSRFIRGSAVVLGGDPPTQAFWPPVLNRYVDAKHRKVDGTPLFRVFILLGLKIWRDRNA